MLAILSFLFGLALLSALYSFFLEPFWIRHTHHAVALGENLSLTIAVGSDFHVRPSKGTHFVRQVVQRINALHPDLILLAGDFLDHFDSPLEALAPLADLRAPLGVFAVLGNHDTDTGFFRDDPTPPHPTIDALRKKLRNMGIILLENEHRIVETTQGNFAIAGIGDIWSRHDDLDRALQGIPAHLPLLLLSHNPDVILDPKSLRANLIVSGHTHGGQMRLPFFGSLAHIPVRIGQKYDQGIFRLGTSTTLAISRGLGEAVYRIRFFARPEVMVLESNV